MNLREGGYTVGERKENKVRFQKERGLIGEKIIDQFPGKH